jgi:cyclic pyranopterin phosphate synthase
VFRSHTYPVAVPGRRIAVPLVDGFARRVRDLRISITDRCNLRCSYCMPAEGMAWLPRTDVLTYEEIARVARLCVERFGFESIRLTGGEPLVRAHVTRLVEMLAPLGVDLALTTNGVKLAEVAHDLRHAGLNRVNVSLDTLRRDRFLALTRRDDLDRVLAGIDAALDAGLAPVKVNAVVMRGVNDDEIVDLARFGRERGVGVRFIEFMPLDAQGAWREEQVVPAREIIDRIAAELPLESVAGSHVEPAARWRYVDGRGDVGVIPSVTEPFCEQCDRVRITAEGQFRTCLFALDEIDLRAELRADGALDAPDLDERLARAIERAVAGKWAGHRIGQVDFVRPGRSMSQIGG